MTSTQWLLLLLVVSAACVFFCSLIYNRLVKGRNEVANDCAQIDVQLRRRHDLIPNLLAVARKYMEHERETLEAVIAARNTATQAVSASSQAASAADPMALVAAMGSAGAVGRAEGALTGSLARLMVVAEAYPELKADTNMRQLTEELSSTENRIGFARQAYNDSVTDYNVLREAFPNNIVAGLFGFVRVEQLQATESDAQRAAPVVSF